MTRSVTASRARLLACACLLALWVVACGGASEPSATTVPAARTAMAPPSPGEQACPARASAPSRLPNTRPEDERLETWLALGGDALDEVLLEPTALAVHDRALRIREPDLRTTDLREALSDDDVRRELDRRLRYVRERVRSGEYVLARGAQPQLLEEVASTRIVLQRELRVALAPLRIRCAPFEGEIRSTTGNPRFDRNRCSSVRAQEPVEVLGQLAPGVHVVRSREAFGFALGEIAWTPPLTLEQEGVYRAAHEIELTARTRHGTTTLEPGTLLPLDAAGQPWIASTTGVAPASLPETSLRSLDRPLTKRAFLEEAFRYVGSPYGWGDEGGGRDCSRLVLDVFRRFGLHLPRTSTEQSVAGTFTVALPPETSEVERLSLLDEAAQRGIVLAHFPGHIMVYLGRDATGVPRALHAFAEYLAPCATGGETLFDVARVSVTDLSLGAGTSRRSFLERITRLTVFGGRPGYSLAALTSFRPPLPPPLPHREACTDSLDVALFRSPKEPRVDQPLRVVATTRDDTRPAGLWLIDPTGALVTPAVHELGVGPFARWIEVPNPAAGTWTALLADGDRVLACERIRVAGGRRAEATPRAPDAPAWEDRIRWERDTEALYAAFVEQLFSDPPDDPRTWSSLSELLENPERNLLYGHLGLDEDNRLKLAPDCADLPYVLRAVFAWKMGLPFAFRACSRGRAGAPPRCGAPQTHEMPIDAEDGVRAFDRFVREHVGAGVHSASGRTLPDDAATDLYPLPYTREALRPGTVFADPYGHMIVVAKWVPQGIAGAGMLLGADAQPDATIGRRRFWRGNFLFTPDTRDVGAGFKAVRPPVRDPRTKQLLVLDDAALSGSRDFAAPSRAQYAGTADDFYTQMDALIYPRPIAIRERLKQIIDALEEQVLRRVVAIDVGEAAIAPRGAPITMPDGYDIFETAGAWEDFATPSRDMRLLIAIDVVRGFERAVREQPQRFGVGADDAASLSESVRRELDAALGARRFRYTRTDKSSWELTLADVVARAAALELAYNPNDCVELRWGAGEGSDELATCARRAPQKQRALMERYRDWFHTRTRPPRP